MKHNITILPKRYGIVSSVMFMTVFVMIAQLIMKTGVIQGLDPYIDQRTVYLTKRSERRNSVEGSILDRYGVELTHAESPGVPAVVQSESVGELVGYNSDIYGQSGLRKRFYDSLFFGGKDGVGGTITTTLDWGLQELAYELLDDTEGAVVVLDNEDGAIRAIASRSSAEVDFDANLIDENWELYNSQDAFWYNRATTTQDPSGSLNKLVTCAAMIENGMEDFNYNDTGVLEVNGCSAIHNFGRKAYGTVGLERALNKSINTFYGAAALQLGASRLQKVEEAFGYNTELELDFCTLTPKCDFGQQAGDPFVVAQTGFGQGAISTNPVSLAVTMQFAVGEGGVTPKPYLLQRIEDDGKTIYEAQTELLDSGLSKKTLKKVKSFLHSTAVGYGFDEATYGMLYAKTGTADLPNGKNAIYYLIASDRHTVIIKQCNTSKISGSLKSKAEKLILYTKTM